jgi:hypothetical protein
MTNYLEQRTKCLIGRKDILPVFERFYDIHTWPGVKYFCLKHPFPMRKTPSGRPMVLLTEAIAYDIRFQELSN